MAEQTEQNTAAFLQQEEAERKKEREKICTWRRTLHQIPETGLDNPQTAAYLKSQLDPAWQIIEFPESGTSFGAWLDNGRETGLAFRTDTDALPIHEKTGLEFASRHPGCMHACGHDGHMSTMLTVADRLIENREQLHDNILLLFQSGEESPGGAEGICRSGIFQDKNIRAVFGMHVWPMIEKGKTALRPQEMMARCAEIDIHIQGKSAHAARHEEGNDAVLCAARLLLDLHAIEASYPDDIYRLLFFGQIQAGTVRNAVAAQASLHGTLRAFQDEIFEDLQKRTAQAARRLEEQTGCTISISYSSGYPAVMNDTELSEAVLAMHPEYIRLEKPEMISEDFAWYQKEVPGVFFFHGTGTGIPLHADTFDLDEAMLQSAADTFCEIAFKI